MHVSHERFSLIVLSITTTKSLNSLHNYYVATSTWQWLGNVSAFVLKSVRQGSRQSSLFLTDMPHGDCPLLSVPIWQDKTNGGEMGSQGGNWKSHRLGCRKGGLEKNACSSY